MSEMVASRQLAAVAPPPSVSLASFMRHTLIYFLGNVAVLALAAGYQVLAGRLLGPREYASVAAVFSIFTLLLVPGQVVSTIAARSAAGFAAGNDVGRLRYFFRAIGIVLAATSIVLTILFVVAAPLLTGFLGLRLATMLSLAPAVLLILLSYLNRGLLQGEQRFLSLSATQSVDALIRVLLAVALISLGFGANGAVLALSAGLAISYLLSFIPLKSVLGSGPVEAFPTAEVLRFVTPAALAVAGPILLTTIDVVLAKHYLGAAEAGLYASVATIGRFVFMVTASITAVMFARVVGLEQLAHRSERTVGLSIGAMVVMLAVALVALAFVPSLFLLPYGAAFQQAAPYLPLYGLGMAAMALANLLVTYMLARRDNRFVLVILGGVALEVILIAAFHSTIWAIVSSLVAACVAVLILTGLLVIPRSELTK